jgi:hypothetical protein
MKDRHLYALRVVLNTDVVLLGAAACAQSIAAA